MIDWALRLSSILVLVMFLNALGGYLEGWVAPVTGPMTIERVEAAENGFSRVWGQFAILRPSCSFKGLEWSLKGVRRDVVASVIFEEGTKERPGGVNDFGPWLVQISPDKIETRSRVIAFHDCPVGWWSVETIMREPSNG